MDELERLLQQAAERQAAEAAVCGHCWHPAHEGMECGRGVTVHTDGVDIDGQCTCMGEGGNG